MNAGQSLDNLLLLPVSFEAEGNRGIEREDWHLEPL
jgi:hypothetical protein